MTWPQRGPKHWAGWRSSTATRSTTTCRTIGTFSPPHRRGSPATFWRDCILAPIPAADYAKHADDLVLLPDIGIGSQGEVGSVLLFGGVPLDAMKTIALPSDSATSVALLKHLIAKQGRDMDYISTGPDYESMMAIADGALLIGDRALEAAKEFPEMVQMDLGTAWMDEGGASDDLWRFRCEERHPLGCVEVGPCIPGRQPRTV